MSKMSVIMPLYNAEKYLEECLDSVAVPPSYETFLSAAVSDTSGHARTHSQVCTYSQKNPASPDCADRPHGSADSYRPVCIRDTETVGRLGTDL